MIKTILTCTLFLFCSLLIAQDDIFTASRKGDTDAVKQMYKINPDTVNAKNYSGHSPLILASYRNQVDMVKLLIELGADIDYNFGQGAAIHGAAFKGNMEIIKVLLEHNAKLNVPDNNGTTPLIYATIFNHTEIAELLFAKGSDPNLKDHSGKSAAVYAKELKNTVLTNLFDTKKTNQN